MDFLRVAGYDNNAKVRDIVLVTGEPPMNIA
jgi:hypothetical protein